ncbi:probable G-protein coupled receptor Mth-like 2 [Macrobrachium rosenbergii]|uniref:probable G-protein coupled receptor Mth-like 2 n=1 Tax=Macrobrachium rosenbergii TaxID=79674 RepID=UPI0034D69824
MFCSFKWLSFLLLVTAVTTSSTAEGTGLSIKRCCSPGFGLSDRTCVPYRQVDLTVAVKLPKVKNISHITIQEHETWDRKCGGDDHKIRQVTVNSHLNFIHVDGTTFFPWTTPEGNEWLVDTFCMEALFEPSGRKEPVFAVEFCHDYVAVKAKDEEIKCQHRTCIRKCCPKGMVFDENCSLRDDILWNPKFFSTKDPNIRVQNPRDLLILYGFPQCKVRLHYENYRVLENGWLHTMDNLLQTIPPNQYCLDLHTHFDGVMKEEVFACYEERDHYCRTRHVVVDLVFMIISCIFLAASLLIYACFRNPRSSNLDRCVIAFLAALSVAFTSIIINRQQQEAVPGAFCSFIGTVNHIGILATYFWLTLLCCHVWFCIRSGRVRDETHLFAAYSLCGWGVPLIVALTGAHLPSDDPYQLNRPRADFLPADCWFKDSALRWGYQYGFMLALFLVDFVLFCCSVVALKRKKQELQYMREEVEGTFLNSKLLLILFVVWAMELIPWWLEANGCNIWVSIVDGLGALCGVYIFFAMFCCSCSAAKIPKARNENTEENPDSPAIELFESPTASAPPDSHYGTADRNGVTLENGRS